MVNDLFVRMYDLLPLLWSASSTPFKDLRSVAVVLQC